MSDQIEYLLLIGKDENWIVSLKNHMWGFSTRHQKKWKKTKVGDLLAFYVTRPTKKIIGFGRVNNKFQNSELVWDIEKNHGECMWPYKISFDIIYTCKKWDDGIDLPKKMMLFSSQKLITKELYLTLIKMAETKWKNNFMEKI